MAQEITDSEPLVEASDVSASWQSEKITMTRRAVLDAIIRCFLKLGYANTTTSKIATEAGLSRGALLHHFPSSDKLIEATVDHLTSVRIQHYRKLIQAIDPHASNRIDLGIDAYWQHLISDSYIAFHELIIASRTNPTLEKILLPKIKQLEEEWLKNTLVLFPEWKDAGQVLELAMDLTQYLMEGMAANRITMTHHQDERKQRLLTYLKARLKVIFELGVQGRPIGEVLHL